MRTEAPSIHTASLSGLKTDVTLSALPLVLENNTWRASLFDTEYSWEISYLSHTAPSSEQYFLTRAKSEKRIQGMVLAAFEGCPHEGGHLSLLSTCCLFSPASQSLCQTGTLAGHCLVEETNSSTVPQNPLFPSHSVSGSSIYPGSSDRLPSIVAVIN